MTFSIPGEVFALLAAFTWAFALVLFKYSGESVPPLALNLFKNAVSIVFLAFTLLAAPLAGPFLADESLARVLESPLRSLGILALSGVIGIAVADTLFFHALNIVVVGIVSIFDCSYSPFVILFAALMLGEAPTAPQYVGAALILGGVLIASGHAPPPNTTAARLIRGVVVGALAMASMAYGIVLATPVLKGFPLIWASTIRVAAGTAALTVVALAMPTRKALWSVFWPSSAWRTSIPAAVLGTYFAYLFWIAGFKYAAAPIAGILNQTSVIFSIILATLVVKEPMTRRKLLAVALAITGVATVVLHRQV